MPKKFNYAKARDALKKIGYNIEYKANDRKTFKTRGTIRRLTKQYAPYLKYIDTLRTKTRADVGPRGGISNIRRERTIFAFKKLSPSDRKKAKASGLWSSNQFTAAGVIVEKPANIKAKDYKLRFSKDSIKVSFGQRRDIIRRLDANNLVVNPKKEIARVIGDLKPQSYGLLVNGFSGPTYQANRFWHYIQNDLLPSFMERAEKAQGEDEALTEFSDIFHVRIVQTTKRKKK